MTTWEIEQGFKPKQEKGVVLGLEGLVKENRKAYAELEEVWLEFESEERREDIKAKKFVLNLELEELIG